MKNYEEMTVPQLREECKERNIPRQENGKKLTKSELIERLVQDDKNISEMFDDAPEANRKAETKEVEHKEKHEVEKINYFDNIIPEIDKVIESRRGTCKPSSMEIGKRVVYVRNIETKSGLHIKKLATAVIVNRKVNSNVIKIETPIATTDVRNMDEILHVSNPDEKFPKDISRVLWMQREEHRQFIARKTEV